MIELAYPSKHETLRVIRGMAYKSLKLPFPETMVETPMPQSSSAALQGVVIGDGVSDDKMEWLGDVAGDLPDWMTKLVYKSPEEQRSERLDKLRRPNGGVGEWADGELKAIKKLSPERQTVWRWAKGFYVTPSEPNCYDAEFETGISHQTAHVTLKQFRAFHGIA
jgi:hypothetical protein